jgi:hypothetical protein
MQALDAYQYLFLYQLLESEGATMILVVVDQITMMALRKPIKKIHTHMVARANLDN